MTILRYIREVRSEDKLLPPKLERQTGRYRESQFTGEETAAKTSTSLDKSELQSTNCWRLNVDKCESKKPQGRSSHREGPQVFKFYHQKLNLALTVFIREKSPHASQRVKVEKPILKQARAFCS